MGEGDEDAELYNPPDHPPPKPTSPTPQEDRPKDGDDESSKPMLTRQSEDGAAFSIGDDEFGTWAEEENDR